MLADIERQAGRLDRGCELRDEALNRLARMPAPHPMQGHVSALAKTLGAKVELVAGDLDAARERLAEGYRVGVATKDTWPVSVSGWRCFAAALERPLDAAGAHRTDLRQVHRFFRFEVLLPE
jgi:hypothetical protein